MLIKDKYRYAGNCHVPRQCKLNKINSVFSEWTLCKNWCCKCCAWVGMATKTLFDDNEEEGFDGGFQINTEFARRFEVRS